MRFLWILLLFGLAPWAPVSAATPQAVIHVVTDADEAWESVQGLVAAFAAEKGFRRAGAPSPIVYRHGETRLLLKDYRPEDMRRFLPSEADRTLPIIAVALSDEPLGFTPDGLALFDDLHGRLRERFGEAVVVFRPPEPVDESELLFSRIVGYLVGGAIALLALPGLFILLVGLVPGLLLRWAPWSPRTKRRVFALVCGLLAAPLPMPGGLAVLPMPAIVLILVSPSEALMLMLALPIFTVVSVVWTTVLAYLLSRRCFRTTTPGLSGAGVSP